MKGVHDGEVGRQLFGYVHANAVVSSDVSRRTSQVAASRGPGLGQEDTDAAAWAMESWGASRGGGDEDEAGAESADGLAPGGGSGGGGAAGESHFVPNTGRKDGMIMLIDDDSAGWQLVAEADEGALGRWQRYIHTVLYHDGMLASGMLWCHRLAVCVTWRAQ
eukprot:CCRYP_016169-RA/>CCRYP_016169-RA protein AED:0.89 eAED:0.91 QI:0/0/0/0.5/1/1/2/0/162